MDSNRTPGRSNPHGNPHAPGYSNTHHALPNNRSMGSSPPPQLHPGASQTAPHRSPLGVHHAHGALNPAQQFGNQGMPSSQMGHQGGVHMGMNQQQQRAMQMHGGSPQPGTNHPGQQQHSFAAQQALQQQRAAAAAAAQQQQAMQQRSQQQAMQQQQHRMQQAPQQPRSSGGPQQPQQQPWAVPNPLGANNGTAGGMQQRTQQHGQHLQHARPSVPPQQQQQYNPQQSHQNTPAMSNSAGVNASNMQQVQQQRLQMMQQQQQQRSQQQRNMQHMQQQQQPQQRSLPHGQHMSGSAQPGPSMPAQQHGQQQHVIRTQAANGTGKPKVVLSQQAKNALAKAIWSAIRSPTGQIAPDLMDAAIGMGLPRHAILNAAKVAREREAQERRNMGGGTMTTSSTSSSSVAGPSLSVVMQQSQHPQHPRPPVSSMSAHSSRPVASSSQPYPTPTSAVHMGHPKPSPPPQTAQTAARPTLHGSSRPTGTTTIKPAAAAAPATNAALQRKSLERAEWKRTHHGVFMQQKDRFLALPFSVGPMVKSKNVEPVLQPAADAAQAKLRAQAAQLQAVLLRQNRTGGGAEEPVLLLDPERFKRVKMEPKKYGKGFDRTVRKSRQGVAERLIKQQKDFAKNLSSHYTDFGKFHRGRRQEQNKLCKAIRDSFDKEERKKEKEEVVAERARMAALKANDMTAYSQLVEETRNERLKFLLEKTDEHFAQISNLLQVERGSMGAGGGEAPTSYYATAHSKTEEVRQPHILVGGDLKEYQLAGLQWLISLYNNTLNGILADEMGLGKTIQAIALVAYLMEVKHNLGPFLVIVPLSTLSNWQSEFQKWCPAARTICYKGTPGQRKEIYREQVRNGQFNVLLTTYEYIIRDKKFLHKHTYEYAIVDEGHRMKNSQSKFAVTLASQYTTNHRVLLTGTPLMNDLSELWSLLNFLLPSIFNSVDSFDDWFRRPFHQFGAGAQDDDDQLLSNEERILIIHRLHELLRPFMLRRLKRHVLDQLPEKVEKVLRCPLSSWQMELYKQISVKAIHDTSALGNQPQAPSRGLNNVVMQLRKVCNHPYLFSPEGYNINDVMIKSSGKFKLLDEMLPKLKAAGHRVLIFTQMTQVMTILEDYFSLRGYQSLRLDGSTPADEREKRMYKFNAPDSNYFIFLLSTRAGGLGLNLTAADTVIIFDSDWNPAMDVQAQDRAHRIGQRSDVSVFRLVTYSPVEEKILSRATEKSNVAELVVETGQFNKDSVDTDNSMERRKLMEVLLTDFSGANASKPASERSGSDDEGDDGSAEKEEEDFNEQLANSENDYQLYSAIDDRNYAEGVRPLELYTEDANVPDWIRYPHQAKSGLMFNEGAANELEGSRKRKEVMYDDGLTDKQFARLMDKQAIAEEMEHAKKKQKIRKSAIATAASQDDDDFTDNGDEEMGTDSQLTDWTFRKLISCSKSVVALKDPSTKRRLSDIFLEKPDPATFPDYYEIIEKPVAINDILRKCRAKVYAGIHEFKDDWQLMFANARKFNGDDSWVVEDAKALDKELERVLKKNGFTNEIVPTSKTKKLRIKFSLKDVKSKATDAGDI